MSIKKDNLPIMKPQDLLILAKLSAQPDVKWTQNNLAKTLFISQSEISESLARSRYAQLISKRGYDLNRKAILEFIQYGLTYVFPQRPGPVVRGTVTAHSAPPLNKEINSTELYVWPYAKGDARGHRIQPLYPSVLQAVEMDKNLHEILALMDSIRVGKAREKNLALKYLKERLC